MLEVTSTGIAEAEEEIELSLELSIGRNYRKADKPKPKERNLPDACSNVVVADPGNQPESSKGSSLPMIVDAAGDVPAEEEEEEEEEIMDLGRKREIHALRRKVDRKKREEKLKKTVRRGINAIISSSAGNGLAEAEAQQYHQSKVVRDRGNEEVLVDSVRCKRERIDQQQRVVSSNGREDLNFTWNPGGAGPPVNPNPMAPNGSSTSIVSMPLPVQFGYSPASYRFVPFSNGPVYPCAMMPCWASPSGNAGADDKQMRNVIRPAASRSFRPYQGNRDCGNNLSIARDSDHRGTKNGEVSKLYCNGSLERSSSPASYQSTSLHGGSNSEAGSHSSHSQHDLEHPEADTSFNQIGRYQNVDKAENGIMNEISSNIPQTNELKASGQAIMCPQAQVVQPRLMTKSDQVMKPATPTETTGMCKPPRPENQKDGMPSLWQMPCVSTTGNGPNGKTITGFLYRYTKTEVSIVCVCHGSLFSPAEFVEHAGGIDISHPLRHITVIPSPFG